MALENMTVMLQKARRGGYAIGAFNFIDYNSMKAIVETANILNAPVIIQTSVKSIKYWAFKPIISWIRVLTERIHIPVAIHLDHSNNLELIAKCIDHGWTSVMIDGSTYPIEKNIAVSKQVLNMARPKGISVEAELGLIAGKEDEISPENREAHLTEPDEAVKFLKEVPVDCFAPAIGTAHGLYKGKLKIAFDRLEQIRSKTNVPLALHGGTGLTEETIRKCIQLGCAKINISTQLKYAYIDGFVDFFTKFPGQYNPLREIEAQSIKLKETIAEYIRMFGCVDKA